MELASIIIFICVLLFAFLSARVYNFIHGIVVYIGLTMLLLFIGYIGTKAGANLVKYNEAMAMIDTYIAGPYRYILTHFKLTFMADPAGFSYYIIPIALLVISWVIASLFRRVRAK